MLRVVQNTLIILVFCQLASAQVSQDCIDAIPICNNTPINGGTNGYGVDDFNGAASTGCLEPTISGTIESNAAWYHFRTGAAGQLGFNIGHDNTEDWDFALYKATDCSNLGDPIRCNFFDNSENVSFVGVGEDPTGNTDSVHYEEWLQVDAGEDYYLFINNFSNANTGFSIQFTGDIWLTNPYDALDCSIVDNLLGPPIAACENDTVMLDATTTGAINYAWYLNQGAGFQLISGASSATYQAVDSGLYRVQVATTNGTIISEVQVGFNPSPITYPVADTSYCYTNGTIIDLTEKDAEALGLQSPDSVLVSYHTSQLEANTGANPLPKQYSQGVGQETIYVRTTSLANPHCFDASQTFMLNAVQSPEPTFETAVVICENLGSVEIGETNPQAGYSYLWDTGEQTPSIVVSQEGEYGVTVANISGGAVCENKITVTVTFSKSPAIAKVHVEDMQLNNTVTIETATQGDYEFRLDDGDFQADATFEGVSPGVHMVTMRDVLGCGEVSEEIVVVGYLSTFTPNGDVLNETWQVEGLSALNTPIVTIYDRYGKLIKQMNEYDPGWDGSFNGKPLPSTDYWFKLSYLDDDGNRVYAKYLQSHFSLRR